jgi:hypothetical protein
MRSRFVATLLLSLSLVGATAFVSAYRSRGVKLRPQLSPSVSATGSVPPELTPGEICANRRQALEHEPGLPGAPLLDASRAEIVARAKAEPVLFLEPPQPGPLSTEVNRLRERLHHGALPWNALAETFARYQQHPRAIRQVLLTDSYLYAEQPVVAEMLANSVNLSKLFSEHAIVVTRGNQTLHATRKRGDYFWADGPEPGSPARLWLFDRVAVEGEKLGPSKLVAFGDLRYQTGANQIEIERLTAGAVLAQLVYGEIRVPAILAIRQNQLQLECEVIPRDRQADVEFERALAKRKTQVLARLRASIDEEVNEALPFDEPKTEQAQQDGKLRQEWKQAYLQGSSSYSFNGDSYPVFGAKGRPRIPQVCVDFIVDSWERMAGTRWLARDEGRARRIGRINFDTLDIENRRSVDRLIEFARARPEWFELLEFAEADRVRFYERHRFFQRLYALRKDFQPGDVVAILGPRDDEKLHYHSFFIVADDPITRMPTLLAANAGRPRIRSWESEMQNAPRRSILARIRPRLSWLEGLAGTNDAGLTDLKDSNSSLLSKRQ